MKRTGSATQIIEEVRTYGRALLDIVYPRYCVMCMHPLSLGENTVCNTCGSLITMLRSPQCHVCARELPPYGSDTLLCSTCRRTHFFFERGYSCIRYDENTKKIFHGIKFGKRKRYFSVFWQFLSLKISEYAADIKHNELIVPVPLDRTRARQREFNQAAIIARYISHSTGISYSEKVLKRVKKSTPQSWLTRKERLANLDGAFCVRRKADIRNKRVMLVDDVLTTGSTVNECARALKNGGARSVNVMTLARAV